MADITSWSCGVTSVMEVNQMTRVKWRLIMYFTRAGYIQAWQILSFGSIDHLMVSLAGLMSFTWWVISTTRTSSQRWVWNEEVYCSGGRVRYRTSWLWWVWNEEVYCSGGRVRWKECIPWDRKGEGAQSRQFSKRERQHFVLPNIDQSRGKSHILTQASGAFY